MKRLRTYILIIAAVIIAAAGFMLPSVILGIQDSRLHSAVETFEIDEVDLSLFSNLSVSEKLVLTSSGGGQEVSLETGRFMDKDGAVAAAVDFLDMFGVDVGDTVPECTVFLKIGENGQTIVLWKVKYATEDYELSLSIDDETGLVLAVELVGSYGGYTDGDYYSYAPSILYEFSELYFYKYLEPDIVVVYFEDDNTMVCRINAGGEEYAVYSACYPERFALYVNMLSEKAEPSVGEEDVYDSSAASFGASDKLMSESSYP